MTNLLEPANLALTGQQLIEASAGTGKTWTICNLYLRLILGHGDARTAFPRPLPVNEILVVTFTIAATEELRSRIRDRIVQARSAFQTGASDDPFIQQLIGDSPDLHQAQKLLDSASQLMDESAIFTIHGFCSKALNENAFETGQLFDLELEADSSEMLQRATEDFWRRTILNQQKDLLAISLKHWSGPSELSKEIATYIGRKDLKIIPAAVDWSQLELNRTALQKKIDALKRLWIAADIPNLLQSSDLGKSRKPVSPVRLQAMSEFAANDQFEFYFGSDEGWDIWSTESITRALKKDGSFPSHPIFLLFDYLNEHFPKFKSELRIYLVSQAITDIRQSIEQHKQVSGCISYDDLLSRLADALADPDRGTKLKTILGRQYPVAMVDEFQDTDQIQYSIFNSIYGHDPATGFLMIGDPKQAIYKFRGADIFTYIKARRNIENLKQRIFTLQTNWRSTPDLIAATNLLFSGQNAFLNDRDIPFEAVISAPKESHNQMLIDGTQPSPITVHFAPDAASKLSKARASEMLTVSAVEETTRLLNTAVLVNGSPLKAGQIAYLVRNSADAQLVQSVLASRGLKSVFVTRDSVFQTETARELLIFLTAVANPGDERLVRTALSIRLMHLSAEEIDSIGTDPIAYQALMDEFANYHYLWNQHNLLPMINRWIKRRNIASQLLGHDDGDRILTDLRHLGELLQHQMLHAPGANRLLVWLRRTIQNEQQQQSDDHQLRLESDGDLIKIITMHGAKGLEYDIVMIPMAVFGRSEAKPFYHRERGDDYENILDLGESDQAIDAAQQEQLAEDIRLLYVAITRARYKCYIGLANLAGSYWTLPFHQTAMAHILDLAVEKQADTNIIERLNGLAEQQSGHAIPLFEWHEVATSGISTAIRSVPELQELHQPATPPAIHDLWRVTSYSALSRGGRLISAPPGIGDGSDPALDGSTNSDDNEYSRFGFPKGAKTGIMLHDLMQHIDFDLTSEALDPALMKLLVRHGYQHLPTRWQSVLNRWIQDILQTPLGSGHIFSLSQIKSEARLNELEFHFPIQQPLQVSKLTPLLVAGGYMQPDQHLEFRRVEGLMTGSIDLVFEHEGIFYLLDYKSNYLGPGYQYYDSLTVQSAMTSHQYHLQYLIYTVALHRYLENCLPDYDYDTHFGGVFYLFLRGMAGIDAPGQGIYFNKPEKLFLEQLDQLFKAP